MQQILLVDDDVNFRRSLMIQLELEGYSVLCEESGAQALEILKNLKIKNDMPGIIVSDIRMPGMNGADFISNVREICPECPVLIMSAFDPPETLSAYPFLRKPFKIVQMVQQVDAVLQGRG